MASETVAPSVIVVEWVTAVELEIAVAPATVSPRWTAVGQEQVTAEEAETALAIAAFQVVPAVVVASEEALEALAAWAHVRVVVAVLPAWVVLEEEAAAEAAAVALEEVAVAAEVVAAAVAGGGSEL